VHSIKCVAPVSFLLKLTSTCPSQVTDRTERIRAAVENYPGSPFEFVSLRLEDCFDATWWRRVGGGDISTAASSLGLNLTDEGQ